jgi:Putative peptidoglycan binding domain
MVPSMTQNQWHTVVDGENILLIAKQAGFRNWRTIFDHPKNEAFRQNNPDPYSIHTGDSVWLPEKTPRSSFQCETDKEHRFVVKTLKALLYLVLETNDDIPYANRKYEIWIDGQQYGTEERHTSADGMIKTEIPVVPELELRVWFEGDTDAPTIYTVRTGDLDPIDTIEGIQDRLNNLGYDCGEEHGEIGSETEAALQAFQSDFGLTSTGELDDATRRTLQKEHDLK